MLTPKTYFMYLYIWSCSPLLITLKHLVRVFTFSEPLSSSNSSTRHWRKRTLRETQIWRKCQFSLPEIESFSSKQSGFFGFSVDVWLYEEDVQLAWGVTFPGASLADPGKIYFINAFCLRNCCALIFLMRKVSSFNIKSWWIFKFGFALWNLV